MLMPKTKKKSKQDQPQHQDNFFPEAYPGFSFVAGCTAWGFPYGTPVEENEEDPDSPEKEELPF